MRLMHGRKLKWLALRHKRRLSSDGLIPQNLNLNFQGSAAINQVFAKRDLNSCRNLIFCKRSSYLQRYGRMTC